MSKKKPETLIGLNIKPEAPANSEREVSASETVKQDLGLAAPYAWMSLADIGRCLSMSAAQAWRIVHDAEFDFVRRLKPSPRSHTRYFRPDFEQFIANRMQQGT